jgi:hypothetical protein
MSCSECTVAFLPSRSLAVVLLCGAWLVGCGLPYARITDTLYLTSVPEGAQASLSTGQECVTPCTVTPLPAARTTVTFARTGCIPVTVSVAPVTEFGIVPGGDALYGTGVPILVAPNPVSANLSCSPLAVAAAEMR